MASSCSESVYLAWTMADNESSLIGKVVRFGPNSLSFNSAAALKDIYGFKTNVRKAEFYEAFVHGAPNTHNCRDKATHAKKRRVLSYAFSDNAMREMERYILGNVRTFCEQIGLGARDERKGWTPAKNMSDWCNYLATGGFCSRQKVVKKALQD